MKWGTPTIAHYAATAGFVRPQLHTATALALASSGGIDHYDHCVGLPGTGRYVGLWAIDSDRWPEYSPDTLKDPWLAARAAYELTQRCGGFGWSSVWAAGHERPHLAHAATAYTLEPFRERPDSPITLWQAQRRITEIGTRLAKVGSRG